jgi:hypothetical protein
MFVDYVKDEDVKVGNLFRGLINNAIFKIVDIKNGKGIFDNTKYVIIEWVDRYGKTKQSETTYGWFKKLQIKKIMG